MRSVQHLIAVIKHRRVTSVNLSERCQYSSPQGAHALRPNKAEFRNCVYEEVLVPMLVDESEAHIHNRRTYKA